jgi:hypothetical protein
MGLEKYLYGTPLSKVQVWHAARVLHISLHINGMLLTHHVPKHAGAYIPLDVHHVEYVSNEQVLHSTKGKVRSQHSFLFFIFFFHRKKQLNFKGRGGYEYKRSQGEAKT